MSYTRTWQAGAELQTIAEIESAVTLGTANPVVSSTKAKTGTYSFRFGGDSYTSGKALNAAAAVRAGFYINHNGVSATSGREAILVYMPAAVNNLYIDWFSTDSTLRIRSGSTTLASVAVTAAGINTVDQWYHIGVIYKGGSDGFITVYVDGVPALTYSGSLQSAINGFYIGGRGTAFNGWNSYLYVDDFYVDVGDGSEGDAPPSSLRFLWSQANAAGTSANLSVSGAGSNYQAVDEAPPNGDTDYVYASASGVKDSYNTADITVPAGHVVNAVIPTSWARRTDAGTDSRWKLGTLLSGTTALGSALGMGTGYGIVFERQTEKPGGGSWSESDVNSAEFVHESAGSF